MPQLPSPCQFRPDDLIPVEFWGKDHYSTLAYIETVMVDCGGFEVGVDPRMRSNRRNFRVLMDGNRKPRRPGSSRWQMAVAMEPKHSSYLKNGATSENHDDWCCVQDMVGAGLVTGDVEPGAVLHLSPLGQRFVVQLREFKATGGNFAEFVPPPELMDIAKANMMPSPAIEVLPLAC